MLHCVRGEHNMKVLIIARGIPSKENPQEGCFEWDQAKALKARGIDVVVMAIDAKIRKSKRKRGISKSVVYGIPFYSIYLAPVTPIEHFISTKLANSIYYYLTKRLFKYVCREHPDIKVIHSHFLKVTSRAVALKGINHIPVVGTEHWSELEKDILNRNVKYLGSKTYNRCDSVISVSESLRERIKQHFNVDSVVIHNMIGMEFELEKNLTHNQSEKFRFVCTGSLIKRKGFDFLIDAFSKSGLQSRAEILIIGEGNQRNELESKINSLGLGNSVFLLGKKQKSEIIETLKTGDAFILPSRSENFSVAVLEALAIGLPVIATICGGIRECINDKNGILVEVDNVDQMVVALQNMVNNINIFSRNDIRHECLRLYGPSVVADEIISVYNGVIENFK